MATAAWRGMETAVAKRPHDIITLNNVEDLETNKKASGRLKDLADLEQLS
jgi:hypothetical protein